MAEQLNFDFDELDKIKDQIDADVAPEEPAPAEPEPPQEPAPESLPEEDGVEVEQEDEDIEGSEAAVSFDQLTPRERELIQRLEKVTGDKLGAEAAGTPVPTGQQTLPAEVEHNFLDGMDLDEVFSTPEAFNKLLNAVYKRGREESAKLSATNILSDLPKIVSQYVAQHMTMAETVAEFYSANPELKHVKRTVAQVANEISAEAPEMALQDVFAEAAKRTYKMLGLKRGAGAVAAPKKPALVQPRGRGGATSRIKAPELDGLAKEIAELIEI